MTDVFMISAEKIVSLMCFFALGFMFARKKLLSDDAPRMLSRLLTLLFCPALTLNGMASNLNRATIRANAGLLLTSAAVILVGTVVSRVLSRKLSRGDADLCSILEYNLLYSNFGYIGYPMILGIFGDAALSRFLLYAVPISISVTFYGRLVVEGKTELSLRFLLQPLSLSMFLGLLIGALEIPLPGVVTDVLSSAGGCTGPVSMLVSGMVLSRVDLRRCFRDWRNYLFTALRLVIIPLFALAVMLPLGVRGESLLVTGCFLCLPFGSNPIVFREALGMDTQKAAGMTLVSYLFSLATVPLMFALFEACMG